VDAIQTSLSGPQILKLRTAINLLLYMDSSMHHLLSTLQTRTAITDLTTLLTCLSAPLDALGLLPPRYRHLLSGDNTDLNINLRKYVPQIQHALLTNILPIRFFIKIKVRGAIFLPGCRL